MKKCYFYIMFIMLSIPAFTFSESLTDRLFSAAWFGETVIIQELIKDGADVNAKRPDGWTALMAAAHSGNADAIKVLIEAKADVNAETNDGWRVLMEAAYCGNVDAAKALMKAGAD